MCILLARSTSKGRQDKSARGIPRCTSLGCVLTIGTESAREETRAGSSTFDGRCLRRGSLAWAQPERGRCDGTGLGPGTERNGSGNGKER